MPKIPTFTAEGSIEQLQGSTQTPQIKLNQTLATALAPVTKMVVDQKIKESTAQNQAEALRLENDYITDLIKVSETINTDEIMSVNKNAANKYLKDKNNILINKYKSLATNDNVAIKFENYALAETQKTIFKTDTQISKNILTNLFTNYDKQKELLFITADTDESGIAQGTLKNDLEKLTIDTFQSQVTYPELQKMLESIPAEIDLMNGSKDVIQQPEKTIYALNDDKNYLPNLSLKQRNFLKEKAITILTPRIDNSWKNYVAAAALGKEPVPFNMDLAKEVLPAETIVKMEIQLETIDDTISKVKILNSINSKELKTTIDQYELEIDAKVQAGTVDFLIGEKKKEYYNNIVDNRQELLSTDPVKFIIDTNEDIKTAVEAIESAEGDQKNILEFELATSLVKIQTDLGVPKYNQKVMTSNQSKSFVFNYKKGDEKTRIAMLQGLDLQFGDLNNKAFQQLLNDGLPETAILSAYFQNSSMTEAFLSFDSPEKKTELKDWGTKNGVKFDKLQKDIATSKAIRIFEDIVAQNTGANSADTVEQMGNIVEILTYYTLNEMFTNNKNETTARKDAVGIIKNNFQIEDTYYIPKIWDGKKLLDSHVDTIVEKTEIIKDHYLDQWGAVAFGSMKDDTLTVDIQSEFEINIKENGEWRNTSDGEGLIFGIILSDGEFAPVKNANGDFLEFNFDNDQYILPGTDIKLNMTLNDLVPENDDQAALPNDNLIFDENSKPRFAGLVETNKFFNYVKKKEGPFFKSATQATEGEAKLTIGYGRYNAAEGQTVNKEEAERMLLEDIESRIPEVINAIPKFDSFSDELQQALFYEWFRGSLVQSPKTRELINAGKFSEAAKEFLNNDEYRNARKNKRSGVISHFELTAKLLNKEGTI
tara:strand:+ start:973 stop:3618 length:2646 start_codon:yes stop_codon:yes gene_type:complete